MRRAREKVRRERAEEGAERAVELGVRLGRLQLARQLALRRREERLVLVERRVGRAELEEAIEREPPGGCTRSPPIGWPTRRVRSVREEENLEAT